MASLLERQFKLSALITNSVFEMRVLYEVMVADQVVFSQDIDSLDLEWDVFKELIETGEYYKTVVYEAGLEYTMRWWAC